MPNSNPYKLLQVRPDADSATIAEAYEQLFDRYEPAARSGDPKATRMLDDLNEAHDILLDPARRAELDTRIAAGNTKTVTTRTTTATKSAPGTQVRTSAPGQRRAGGAVRSTQPARARAVEAPARRSVSPVFLIFGGILLFLIVITASFFLAKNSNSASTNAPVVVIPTGTVDASNLLDQPTPESIGGTSTKDPNAVVATVSGEPVLMRDLVKRNVKDIIVARNDPLMGNILAQGGITSTRIIDVLAQDSLDKQINLQVILLQAKKEGLYPEPKQIDTLVEQAKLADLNGADFKQFLADKDLTEEQYRSNVVRSVVYAVMASKHAGTATGEEERTTTFVNWICATRKSYDIKINLKFAVPNQPCTSGLPTDLPLSDTIPSGTPGTGNPPPVETGAPDPGK